MRIPKGGDSCAFLGRVLNKSHDSMVTWKLFIHYCWISRFRENFLLKPMLLRRNARQEEHGTIAERRGRRHGCEASCHRMV